MAKIIVNSTLRDFTGSINDKMQLNFLKSLKRQTMQDFILVVTIFGEHNVENTVRSILSDKCVFIYDEMEGNYKFSLSKTFINGVDYGLKNKADILLDCSSDIILQRNFLEVVLKRCGKHEAGISHPNVFMEISETGNPTYSYGKISQGIDARFFSLDIFKDKHIYNLMKKYPSYDYGAGIETQLCCIGIKYAKRCSNIFMESKVLKTENDRGSGTGQVSLFMQAGRRRNIPTVMRMMKSEGMSSDYIKLDKVNKKFKPTKHYCKYKMIFNPVGVFRRKVDYNNG